MLKKFVVTIVLYTFLSPLALANNTHEYTLKNGLKLVVKEDHRAPIVVSKICYKVGAAYEPGGLTGISHALEHMMFKGTAKYPSGEFSKLIAENGGKENAYTSRDYTCYYQKLAAEKLPLSFKLEADRMRHLTLSPKEFAKEIQVVMEERRMRTDDNPQALTYERFNAAAHIVSPYHHMTIGWMDDLKNMEIGDLKTWYKKWYAPNNAILIVVGDVEPNRVLKLANQYFSHIPSSKITPLKPQQALKPLGERHLTVKAPAKLPWLIMGFNTPSLVTDQEKWRPYALEVIAAILDGGDSARLPKHLIRDQHIAASINVSYSLYRHFAGLFSLMGTPSSGHTTSQLKKAILNEIQDLQKHLVSKKVLEKIKTQVIAGNVYQQDSLFYQAMLIGRLASVGLSWREVDNYVKQIQAITPEQIQSVAKTFFVPERLTVAELKPEVGDQKSSNRD